MGCGIRFVAVSVLTGVTQEGSQATRWLSWSKHVGYRFVKCGRVCLRCDGTPFVGDLVILCCREKHRREVLVARTLNRHR